MNAVRSYNVSFKYQRSTSSGCKDYENLICDKDSILFVIFSILKQSQQIIYIKINLSQVFRRRGEETCSNEIIQSISL